MIRIRFMLIAMIATVGIMSLIAYKALILLF